MNTPATEPKTLPFPEQLLPVLWRVLEHGRYGEYLDYQKNSSEDHIYRAKAQLLRWLGEVGLE